MAVYENMLFFCLSPNMDRAIEDSFLKNFPSGQCLVSRARDPRWHFPANGDELRNDRFVSGYLSYWELFSKMDLARFLTVTYLRDPWDRLSYYLGCLRQASDPGREAFFLSLPETLQLFSKKLSGWDLASMEDVAEMVSYIKTHKLSFLDNGQVRILSRVKDGDVVTFAHLKEAFQALRQISIVGDAVHPRNFFEAVGAHMGWLDSEPPQGFENELKKPEISMCDPAQRNALWPLVHYDQVLYSQKDFFCCAFDRSQARTVPQGKAAGIQSADLLGSTLGSCREVTAVPDPVVDIILPVYLGKEETLACIQSVLDAAGARAYQLTVISDASPDSALVEQLKKKASQEGFCFLENEKNLGFVATVNRGMNLNPMRDVVLLNADTLVPSGWLDALRRTAYADPSIGTVTPFSNNATICSLPQMLQDKDLPEGHTVNDMHALCQKVNAGVWIDIPTGVGFCMYIKRAALDQTGTFNVKMWGRGYGEENDFCLRAASHGWRHVVACDVFVQHHGSVSFQYEKKALLQKNVALLEQLYPQYSKIIKKFIERDPLLAARNRVSLELLTRKAPRYMLFVTHSVGGGTEKAVRELGCFLEMQGERVLVLRSTPGGRLLLTSQDVEDVFCEWPQGTSVEPIVDALAKLRIWHIHFHQITGFKKEILELPARLNLAYDFTVHDFLALCPRDHLLDYHEKFCGLPEDESYCATCLAHRKRPQDRGVGDEFGGVLSSWRAFYLEKIKGARKVFVPSRVTERWIQRIGPIPNLRLKPHPESTVFVSLRRPRLDRDGFLRVAVIGAISVAKGRDLLFECALYAKAQKLPLLFQVIGFTNRTRSFSELDNVVVSGSYEPGDLSRWVEAYQPSVALFLSIWPETFSYTLSEAWRHHLYPVALDMGAQAERIRQARLGSVLGFPPDPALICQKLMALATDPRNEDLKNLTGWVGDEYPDILADYYEMVRDIRPSPVG